MSTAQASTAHTLRRVFWQLTSGCNLNCLHCVKPRNGEELSYGEACRVIDQIAEFAPVSLVFGGGEPLWRRDVFGLAVRARAQGIRTALSSNGTLIDEPMAERIQSADIARVAVALDGADEATHDSARGVPGAFQAACEGLLNLQRAGVSTQIDTLVTRANSGQLGRIIGLAEQMGASAVRLFLLTPLTCGLTAPEPYLVSHDEAERILAWLAGQKKKTRVELKATCTPAQRDYRMASPGCGGPGIPLAPLAAQGLHSMAKGCMAGSGLCFISPQGEVYPCGYLPVSAGNVRTERFADIWQHADVFRMMKKPGSGEDDCTVCPLEERCLCARARGYGFRADIIRDPLPSELPGPPAPGLARRLNAE